MDNEAEKLTRAVFCMRGGASVESRLPGSVEDVRKFLNRALKNKSRKLYIEATTDDAPSLLINPRAVDLVALTPLE